MKIAVTKQCTSKQYRAPKGIIPTLQVLPSCGRRTENRDCYFDTVAARTKHVPGPGNYDSNYKSVKPCLWSSKVGKELRMTLKEGVNVDSLGKPGPGQYDTETQPTRSDSGRRQKPTLPRAQRPELFGDLVKKQATDLGPCYETK